MARLTKNFKREEFSCKCGCGYNTADFDLVNICQEIADHFEDVVNITSGCRCHGHNKAVGGSANSQHLLGRAADLKLKHTDPEEVQEYLTSQYPDSLGIGKYNTFTHIDTRDDIARWEG